MYTPSKQKAIVQHCCSVMRCVQIPCNHTDLQYKIVSLLPSPEFVKLMSDNHDIQPYYPFPLLQFFTTSGFLDICLCICKVTSIEFQSISLLHEIQIYSLGLTVILSLLLGSPKSSSSTTEGISSSELSLHYGPTFTSVHTTTGKTML